MVENVANSQGGVKVLYKLQVLEWLSYLGTKGPKCKISEH